MLLINRITKEVIALVPGFCEVDICSSKSMYVVSSGLPLPPLINNKSTQAMEQEDNDTNSDLSCDSDDERLPSIEENQTDQIAPGMFCQCFEFNVKPIRKVYPFLLFRTPDRIIRKKDFLVLNDSNVWVFRKLNLL